MTELKYFESGIGKQVSVYRRADRLKVLDREKRELPQANGIFLRLRHILPRRRSLIGVASGSQIIAFIDERRDNYGSEPTYRVCCHSD